MRLVISSLPGEVRLAWLSAEGSLIDLRIERCDRPSLAGSIFLGRVDSIDRGLDAAFLDIGQARPGFLPLARAPKGLAVGTFLTVAATSEPMSGKGAKLRAVSVDLCLKSASDRRPAMLRSGFDPVELVVGGSEALTEVVTDDPLLHRAIKVAIFQAGAPLRVKLQSGAEDLFETWEIGAEIASLLNAEVPLSNGGSLIIEPGRTLTAVDVNTASLNSKGGFAHAAAEVDEEAASELARQLRLRVLGGLVVVDFLELPTREARRVLVDRLSRACAGQGLDANIRPMSPSGLVEMSLPRRRKALHEVLTDACAPETAGRVMAPASLAFEALRAARREALRSPGQRVSVEASREVADVLNGPARQAKERIEELLGCQLTVKISSVEGCGDGYRILAD